MWTSSASERARRPRLAPWLATALVVAGLASCASLAAAKARVRGGDRIEVNSEGITIVHSDSSVDSVYEGEGVHVDADVLGKGIEIDLAEQGDGIVRLFSDASVPSGRRVSGDVVALFGDVEIGGEISGSAVAVMGSVRLLPGASVDGDAVSVGGAVDQPEGAGVGGQTVSIGFLPFAWGPPGLPVMLALLTGGWLTSLLFGWLFALVFPGRLVRVAATASRRTAASFFAGLVSFPACCVLAVLLLVTVIGAPIALLLPLVYALTAYAGQIAATYVLGCKLTSRRPGERGLMLPIVAGLTAVAVCFAIAVGLAVMPGAFRLGVPFFGLLGALLLFGLSCIGTGAFLLSRFGRDPRDVVWRGEEPQVAPGPPAPVPAAPPTV
jgi:cytoskeletal protein CcmA (bactofilin family)